MKRVAIGMIRNVALAAERAFNPKNGQQLDVASGFKDNYDSLHRLVSRLNASHVGLSKDSIVSASNSYKNHEHVPTATTIHVHEDPNYSIGVFILGPDKKIPLHDHPNMFGMIKCIHGTISIKSYTPLPANGKSYTVPSNVSSKVPKELFPTLIPCKLSEERVVLSSEETVCSLDPANGNIHEITAVGGKPAAFIDILSPPYDGQERDCTYYSLVSEGSKENEISWLLPTQPPQEYWTQPAEYRGPSIV